jgi:hypothetical protein
MDTHKRRRRSPSLVNIKDVHNLNERTKELDCLFQAINILGIAEHGSLEKALQQVTDILPSGMQFPGVACARIVIGEQEYRSRRYVHSRWLLNADILVDEENDGSLEVAYTEMRPDNFRGPFLEEEVFLLNAVASLVGQAIYRKKLINERNQHFKHLEKTYQKVLSGFIPICASCKSVRDEKGLWHRLEAYVQKRTEATFSHGICPVCMKTLYPFVGSQQDRSSPAQ